MAKKKKKDTMTGVAVGGMIGMNVVGLSKSRKKIKLETKQTKRKPKRPFGYKGVWWYKWKEV